MQAAQNASNEQARQQSLDLLNRHLAAAFILQDRMRRSPRNLRGANFIMIDETCDQVASLMESCSALIIGRIADLDGTSEWPVRPGETVAHPPSDAPGAGTPLDSFGQSVLDAVSVAAAYGDSTTAEVMEQIWRGVDRQLWKTVVHLRKEV